MQSRIPLGYRLVNGRAELDPDYAPVIRTIYRKYLSGTSLIQLREWLKAQGGVNADGKCSWNHARVGRILEDQKYLGDDFYPMMIDKEIFEQVQDRRREICQGLGRDKQMNRSDRKTAFKGKIICGNCGCEFRKYVANTSRPEKRILWNCRSLQKRRDKTCKRINLEEVQIYHCFTAVVNRMISGEVRWRQRIAGREPVQPYRIRELSEQIQELENNFSYNAEEMVFLIFERARIQYAVSVIDDQDYQAQKLEAALTDRPLLKEFDEELFETVVRQIIVGSEGELTFRFMNGFETTIKSEINGEEGRHAGGRQSGS